LSSAPFINFKRLNLQNLMLIIDVKDNESIDRALKRYKRKYRDSQVMKELRRRQEFVKPSITRRAEVLKAVYMEEKKREVED